MYANICMYMYIMCMFISFIIEVEFHYEIYYIIHLLLTIGDYFVSGHINDHDYIIGHRFEVFSLEKLLYAKSYITTAELLLFFGELPTTSKC